jgi:hypothetical protein
MLAETELPSVSGAPAQGLRGEGFRSELVDPARLLLIQAEWRRLFEGACDPNPFLGPDFFLPLVAEVAGDRLTGVMVLRTDEAPRRSEFASDRVEIPADLAPRGGGVRASFRERRDAAPAT